MFLKIKLHRNWSLWETYPEIHFRIFILLDLSLWNEIRPKPPANSYSVNAVTKHVHLYKAILCSIVWIFKLTVLAFADAFRDSDKKKSSGTNLFIELLTAKKELTHYMKYCWTHWQMWDSFSCRELIFYPKGKIFEVYFICIQPSLSEPFSSLGYKIFPKFRYLGKLWVLPTAPTHVDWKWSDNRQLLKLHLTN